jgi:hypothetical protein
MPKILFPLLFALLLLIFLFMTLNFIQLNQLHAEYLLDFAEFHQSDPEIPLFQNLDPFFIKFPLPKIK